MNWELFWTAVSVIISFFVFGLSVVVEMKKTRRENEKHAIDNAVNTALLQTTLEVNSKDTKDIKATLSKQDTRLDKITVNVAQHEIRLCNLEKLKEREDRKIMDWSGISDILVTIIEAVIITIIIPMLSVALKSWITSHVKSENQKIALSFLALVTDAVTNTYQTYVEAIKGTDAWTAEAQAKALNASYNYIITNMSDDISKWLTKNQPDIEAYIKTQIETVIGTIKDSR